MGGPGVPMNAPGPSQGPYGQPAPPGNVPYPGPWGALGGHAPPTNPDVHLPYFPEDRERLGGLMDGQNPFAGQEWGGLIKQLQDQAAGRGPSLAMDAYRTASQDTTAGLSSMAHGSASPAAARQAMIQQGRVGQGLAAGLATARTQEQMGAQSALAGALGQRDTLNQNAYLDVLAKQLGMSRAEMEALAGNRDARNAKAIADKQASAAKYNAIAGGLGAVGGLF